MKKDLPEGWDEEKIQRIIEEYDQHADGRLLQARGVRRRSDTALVEVPKDLLPAIRELLAQHGKRKAG
jgi:hypothetical protein